VTAAVPIDPVRETRVEAMAVRVVPTEAAMGDAAAEHAANVIRDAIDRAGEAHVMFASGNSQLAFLRALRVRPDIDWSRVVGFHMDEYLGMAAEHPASFRRYMREQLVEAVQPRMFHEIHGDAPDGAAECARYAGLLRDQPLDLCCLGIGENGHLAFNDPPVADFEDPLDVKVVALDEACRTQQVGEGHFATFDTVPTHAITVTIPALLRAAIVLAIVPEARKQGIVHAALAGPCSTACPASVLRSHDHVTLYLDAASGRNVA
jgi:glucosamine-6-phosphate deaminase